MFRPRAHTHLLFVLACLTWAHAQYEVPNEIFQRTLLIRSGKDQATALKFDQDGQIYLVTTRHFGKNLPRNSAVVQVWHNQTWNDLHTVRTLFPASEDVDLAILETGERIAKPYTAVKSEEVLTTEQKVWVMGWIALVQFPKMPATMPKTSQVVFPEIPMVTIGKVSAIDPSQPDSFEIRTRGFDSNRTAGGPIIYWSPIHRDFEILGVIKRIRIQTVKDPTDAKDNQSPVNWGILKGYSIDLVVDTIRHNPHP